MGRTAGQVNKFGVRVSDHLYQLAVVIELYKLTYDAGQAARSRTRIAAGSAQAARAAAVSTTADKCKKEKNEKSNTIYFALKY